MTLSGQRDLFLSDPEPVLFEEEAAFGAKPDPERIRLQLAALLETARKAATMPWPERDARMWQIAFPQMSNWLPPDEAAQLRFEFAREMQRLARAVCGASAEVMK
jgi:hypothetical protein